jgi:hypothetical protein
MKTYKNITLTVLLFAFAFFTVHDYFVQDLQVAKYENAYKSEADVKKDLKVSVHESIHSVYSKSFENSFAFEERLLDTKPSNKPFSITSNITQVLQKPPSA